MNRPRFKVADRVSRRGTRIHRTKPRGAAPLPAFLYDPV